MLDILNDWILKLLKPNPAEVGVSFIEVNSATLPTFSINGRDLALAIDTSNVIR